MDNVFYFEYDDGDDSDFYLYMGEVDTLAS
jgi:hypothetical protein